VSPAAPPRLVGVTQYDATTTRGGSGLPYFLFRGLRRTGALDEVVDVGPTRAQRLALIAAAVHPDTGRWRWRLWNGPGTTRVQTHNATRRLAHLGGSGAIAVQTLGMFRITTMPYVLVLDATLTAMARDAPDTIAWRGRAFEEMVRAEHRTYLGAHHVFALSRFVRDSLVEQHGVDPARITVTGAGPNFEELPVLGAAGRERPDGPPTILFVGRLFERKGGEQLLRAFAAVRRGHPSARLQVVGGHVGAPQDGVEYLGAVEDRTELRRLYAEADVFCLPSLFEPHGLSTLEAMAYALPCVVADVGGLRDTVLPGQTGHLVPPGDVDALAHALGDLLDDRARAADWGRAGRRRIEQELNWDEVGRRIVATLAPGGPAGDPAGGGR
jgi:glycosyltransferase involved in cell wall biosynthesis